MLLFYRAEEADLPSLCRDGIARPGGRVHLWTALAEARAGHAGPVLVVDAARLGPVPPEGAGRVEVARVPPEAVLNGTPYLDPRPVTAAGGYVVRYDAGAVHLLLIFRRGVWDLPKGKQDAGESVEACAVREVREEVGIRALTLRRALGTTVHGYAERGAYRVKTTYWFLMETPERHFSPQAEEAIEAVSWFPWPEAKRRLGFETLRRHMEAVEAHVVAGG